MSTPRPQDSDSGDSVPVLMDECAAAEALVELLMSTVLASRATVASMQASEAQALSALVQVAQRQADLSGKRWASERDIPLRSIAADLAAELRVSDTTVQRNLGDAYAITTLFPATREAWERGEITRTHVNQILTVGSPILDPARRGEFEAAILPIARETSASRTGAAARRLVERYMDEPLQTRHDSALTRRAVQVRDVEDGMAELTATIDAVLAHGIYDRLTQQARTLRDQATRTDPGEPPAPDEAPVDNEGSVVEPVSAANQGSVAERVGAETRSDPGCSCSDADESGTGQHDACVIRDADSSRPSCTDSDADGIREHAEVQCTTRSLDALRADILTDLLLTGGPDNIADFHNVARSTLAEIHGIVQVTIPVLTLVDAAGRSEHGTELGNVPGAESDPGPGTPSGAAPNTEPGQASGNEPDAEPGFLNGRCPIDPDTARRLAGGTPGLDRVMCHPVTGAILAVDRYRPSQELKRFLTARDEHCRFPGCRTPAHRCDIDHTIDAAHGGETSVNNLAHLCRRHHTLKHATRWSVTQRPGGILQWTSPTMRGHTDRPPSHVRFTPTDPDPPPF